MIKLLHLELHDDCNNCPYCRFSNINHDYYCTNDYAPQDAPAHPLLESFPDWCPLPTWKDGDKF